MNLAIRKIKTVLGFVLLLALTGHAQAQSKEQLTVALSRPGKPFVLNIRVQSGSVRVIAYTGNEIQVEASPQPERPASVQNTNRNSNQNSNQSINEHSRNSQADNVLRPVTGGEYIAASESANSVVITQVSARQPLSVLIRVPKNNGVFRMSSMLYTDITFEEVTGELDINNNAGHILLKNISGSAVVSNAAGLITATFSSVESNRPMAFSTVSGHIDISFPPTLKADIKVNADYGKLFSDFDIDFASARPQPAITRTGQGQYQVEIAGGLSGRIGGGGPDIRVKNMVGNIYIRKTK